MATLYFTGAAAAVAKVVTVQVTSYDAATTYKINVGGLSVSSIAAGGVNAAATALASAWNAETRAYFTGITAAANTDTVTLTADTPGVDFTVTSSVSGGAGTIGAATVTTANAGPNDWRSGNNWWNATAGTTGTAPTNGDTVVIEKLSIGIAWGLDQSSVLLTKIIIRKSYSGKIGLRPDVFATSADAATTSAAREYRQRYLKIQWTTAELGENTGPGNPDGSTRLFLHNAKGSGTSTTTVIDTSSTEEITGRPVVQFMFDGSGASLYVQLASGGAGVCVGEAGETSTVSLISVADSTTASKVRVGSGVTLTTWYQQGGDNVLNAADTVTTASADGGNLRVEGDYTITTLNNDGASIIDNHIRTGGAAITTLNARRGKTDFTKSTATRTLTTVNADGGEVLYDPSVVTLTNVPAGVKPIKIAAAA